MNTAERVACTARQRNSRNGNAVRGSCNLGTLQLNSKQFNSNSFRFDSPKHSLTIHKAQGASLDLVVVDLEGCFTSGQAYVALSRARTVAGLRVRHYHPHLVKADPRALAFYDALNRQCAALASSSSAS